MLKVYAVHDECHGIIGYYANEDKAKERCKANATLYDIDPEVDPLEYDWGWDCSYVEEIEVIE